MSEARDLIESHVRVFNERAWEEASDIYAPDFTMVEPAGTTIGVAAYLATAKGFVTAFPDSRMEVCAIIDSGDHVVIEGVYSGTNDGPLSTPHGDLPPTGRTLKLPLCDVCQVAAGRIVSVHAYYDQMTFSAQLGLISESQS